MNEAYNYYYNDLPLNWIINTEKELEKRLYKEELNLSLKCSPAPAYIRLDMKNGSTYYVAKGRTYFDGKYVYKVELYDDDVKVISKDIYTVGESKYPLWQIAVKLLQYNRLDHQVKATEC